MFRRPDEINGIATITNFADMFALIGTVTYDGVRPFIQLLLGGSGSNIPGTATFSFNIDFDAGLFCPLTCTITVKTLANGGNKDDSTGVNTVNYSGRSNQAIDIFTDAALTNPKFNGTFADVFDFNDGTGNIVANNLVVDVHYDDGAGNKGTPPFSLPTDPGIFTP